MPRHIFECDICKTIITTIEKFATGYAYNKDKNKICYDCCAEIDKQSMIEKGHSKNLPLYLTKHKGTPIYKVSNWPGSLVFNVGASSEGKHNIARTRINVWFKGPDGFIWQGTKYGNNTDIVHCKRTKKISYTQL